MLRFRCPESGRERYARRPPRKRLKISCPAQSSGADERSRVLRREQRREHRRKIHSNIREEREERQNERQQRTAPYERTRSRRRHVVQHCGRRVSPCHIYRTINHGYGDMALAGVRSITSRNQGTRRSVLTFVKVERYPLERCWRRSTRTKAVVIEMSYIIEVQHNVTLMLLELGKEETDPQKHVLFRRFLFMVTV